MTSKTPKTSLLNRREEYIALFESVINGYEDCLGVDNLLTITHNTRNILGNINESKVDYSGIINKTSNLDTALSVAMSYADILNIELINKAKIKLILEANTEIILNYLSKVDTMDIVSKKDLIELANIADNYNDRNSIEYRILRVIVICRYLDLVACVCFLSKLVLIQAKK